uniref:ADP-ribosylation factor-like protein 2-binding protein n=1 Tax=Angiostrongylus cantonensis TaxID=6313 RepID=A0A0K0DPL2_ANGCA
MLDESLKRAEPTGLLLHATGKNGGFTGARSSHSTIIDTTGDTGDTGDVDLSPEVTLGYMDASVKEDSRADANDEDGDSDSATESSLEEEEKEIETFTTKFDGENGPDVFALFKRTMNDFERNEPELYRKMVGNLSPNVAESFQNLIKDRGRLNNPVDASFDAAAVVFKSFDFTK